MHFFLLGIWPFVYYLLSGLKINTNLSFVPSTHCSVQQCMLIFVDISIFECWFVKYYTILMWSVRFCQIDNPEISSCKQSYNQLLWYMYSCNMLMKILVIWFFGSETFKGKLYDWYCSLTVIGYEKCTSVNAPSIIKLNSIFKFTELYFNIPKYQNL